MNDSDIGEYLPSLLNPRSIKKSCNLNLTQDSSLSRSSLSLKRCNVVTKLKEDRKKDKENVIFKCNKITQSIANKKNLSFSIIEDLNCTKDSTILLSNFSISISDNKYSIFSHSSATELSCDDTLYDITNNLHKIGKRKNINNNYSKMSTKDFEVFKCEKEMATDKLKQLKRSAVSVNIEKKKAKLSPQAIEENKILFLNTSDRKKLSDVIVQPTNYKLIKEKIKERNKLVAATRNSLKSYGLRNGNNLKQQCINSYFSCRSKVSDVASDQKNGANLTRQKIAHNAPNDMSKNLCITATRQDVAQPTKKKNEIIKTPRKLSHRSMSPRMETREDPQPPKLKNERVGSYSPRKVVESIQFNLPTKSRSNKTSTVSKVIPHYKIVAGTHFAVDAFCYGEIANVKHYFLTHFHSDHYSGLKKSFNKMLFCSKITADLCISRLGVSVKCIHIMNLDEPIKIDGVEITAIDANHCPGAVMLIFTLPNGKSMLHTGDFRASPTMESYPVFWNKDIHTVYLDTTYCNPRYDFPTQDESLEMALYHLRQKKAALETAKKKFSSVLIVCGTYTIGKEKFFLGMARRVGCTVWACPEKDRVLQAVEGRSFSHAPPQSCQLHVVPMRDLTHEKLRSYLDSLQGAFTEIVAFKPSGWENGRNSCVEKDSVTIHGIPYSEHSSFSEMIRFVKFLKPKQVIPTVDITGGIKAVQKYFPCPLIYKEDLQNQSKLTDYISIQCRHQPAVT
ncbi:DNA cross-link repair 1A protein-like [Pieris brassicae]|uniref:DNA cross-link repair 1A protein-like n=1 Tax=Pieris brassicae TaxID=7116 RepID=UPI001E660781|nr:DNA cross-link repair 1A protein-like [Pieris brassicae]XP_045522209.1 DNA cross-link repair 1A protein-like [Pieris brassicae]